MERDDIYEYSLDTHHSEEVGKKVRSKILKVTVILTLITIVEVLLGAFIKQGTGVWPLVKWSFVLMTIIKAAYIVMVFMHLGDENKNLRYIILVPYIVFIIYILFILLYEGAALNSLLKLYMGV